MVRNSCPGDIDSSLPMAADDNCDALVTASDALMYRLQVIQDWLNTIELTMPIDAQKRLKVAIIPFTGGSVEEGRGDAAKMNYVPVATAKLFVNDLVAQQKLHRDALIKNDDTATPPNLMGTSVPSTRLTLLQNMVLSEINLLKTTDDLKNSNFQFVFISDGEPTPQAKDVKATMNRIWTYRGYAIGPGQGVGGFQGCISQCSSYLDSVLDPANQKPIALPPEPRS